MNKCLLFVCVRCVHVCVCLHVCVHVLAHTRMYVGYMYVGWILKSIFYPRRVDYNGEMC